MPKLKNKCSVIMTAMYRLVLVLFLWLCCTLTLAAEQKPVSVPDTPKDFSASAAHNWHSQLPTFTLTAAVPRARTGKVWVRKAPEGLLIAGQVDGAAPEFPSSADALMSKDHVEIWLAQQPYPEFPVMGWGNQFGEIQLPQGRNSCAEEKESNVGDVNICQEWAKSQNAYRIQLKRLFVRQWQLSPQAAVETFATAAYRAIGNESRAGQRPVNVAEPLKPAGAPALKTQPNPSGGYDFETLVPWNLFPPSSQASLQDLYLLVEVFNAAPPDERSGPYSSTAPGRGYADFASFNHIRLEHPRQFTITPCDYPAVGANFFDQPAKGYFLPTSEGAISKTFILQNHFEGYAYNATGFSPEVALTSFFWKKLEENTFVCGPLARLAASGKSADIVEKTEQGPHQVAISKDSFDVLALPDNSLLLRNGPRVAHYNFGAGQCGACPRAELEIYSIQQPANDQHAKAVNVLSIYQLVGNELDDADIQFSKDWNRVEVYRHKSRSPENTWDDESYCRKDISYEKCGTAKKKPPQPRSLKLYKSQN
jgi:hypothetical protein